MYRAVLEHTAQDAIMNFGLKHLMPKPKGHTRRQGKPWPASFPASSRMC